jgi:hypothetical protein
MEKTFWEYISNDWAAFNYTGLFLLISSLFALIVGLKNYQKERCYQFFIIYILSSILLLNIGVYFITYFLNLRGIKHVVFLESINTVFALVEIISFFYLFKKVLHTKFNKKVIKTFWIAFIILCIYFIWKLIGNNVTPNQITNYSFLINCIEFFILLLLCLQYFYLLITKEARDLIPLSHKPSFWIISGLFFYCVVSLPLLLIGNRLFLKNKDIYLILGSIHYISFSFLFLCLAKAFSCKTTLTT